jgi:hypothetical protein
VDILKYPAVKQYLSQFKERLTPRPRNWRGQKWHGRKPGPYQWYEIQDTVAYYREFEKPKILWPGISAEVTAFTLDEAGYYGNDNTQILISDDRYLLGILNSHLMRFLLLSICDKVQGGFYRLKIIYVEQVPIRPINLSDPADKAWHDRIVALVGSMLGLHKQLTAAKSAAEKAIIQRQIDATDAEIDRLVYDLYGLTAEEIALVEGQE